jgi:hypothetical protein
MATGVMPVILRHLPPWSVVVIAGVVLVGLALSLSLALRGGGSTGRPIVVPAPAAHTHVAPDVCKVRQPC